MMIGMRTQCNERLQESPIELIKNPILEGLRVGDRFTYVAGLPHHPKGDHKGPHSTPLHSRPYKDYEDGISHYGSLERRGWCRCVKRPLAAVLQDFNWTPVRATQASPRGRGPFGILCFIFIALSTAILLTSCASGDQQQAQQLDPRLKSFHILSSRIIILDSQAEVDGTIQNTGNDRYPFDVTVDATFYDKAGNVIGQAEGVAEDVLPGMSRAFVLIGQVDSLRYSHMELTLVSLRERRKEQNLPTPPPVSP